MSKSKCKNHGRGTQGKVPKEALYIWKKTSFLVGLLSHLKTLFIS